MQVRTSTDIETGPLCISLLTNISDGKVLESHSGLISFLLPPRVLHSAGVNHLLNEVKINLSLFLYINLE